MQLDRTVRQSKHGNKTQVDSPMEITSAASGSDRIGRTGDQETTETLEINCAVPLRVLEIWARDVHLSNIDCCQPLMKRTQTNESLNQQIWTQCPRTRSRAFRCATFTLIVISCAVDLPEYT